VWIILNELFDSLVNNYALTWRVGLNCRIPCHWFACHWIRIVVVDHFNRWKFLTNSKCSPIVVRNVSQSCLVAVVKSQENCPSLAESYLKLKEKDLTMSWGASNLEATVITWSCCEGRFFSCSYGVVSLWILIRFLHTVGSILFSTIKLLNAKHIIGSCAKRPNYSLKSAFKFTRRWTWKFTYFICIAPVGGQKSSNKEWRHIRLILSWTLVSLETKDGASTRNIFFYILNWQLPKL